MKNTKAYTNTLLLLVVITAVAIDVSIPVLPIITEYFGVEKSQSQLIISTYLVGYGLFMIPLGMLSDRIGRLPIIYFGLIVYTVAGLLIAFAWSFELVLLGRFIQGIGGGVGPVIARAIARDLYAGKELAKIMSAIVAALAIATLVSPLAGSFLYALWGWQATFLVSPLLGLVVLIGLWLTGYETLNNPQKSVGFVQQFLNKYLTSINSVFYECLFPLYSL